jgi:hypothetical protein
MTLEESLNQKLAALATLRYLSKCGSCTYQRIRADLSGYDLQSLIRGIALAESLGGIGISIDKKKLGAVYDFSLVQIASKVKSSLTILERQLWYCASNHRADATPTAEAV